MKKSANLSARLMVIGFLLVGIFLLAGAGPADAMNGALAPGNYRALKMLSRTENVTETESSQYHNDVKSYLQKKLKYYQFLDRYIADRLEEFEGEGISISVISRHDLLFLKGYGYADKETQTAATPFSLFGIGSVSKLFTGIAIMQLVEQGRIDLDAPLEEYIPDFGYKTHFPDAGPITVRTLMTHQSGLVGDILKNWYSAAGPEHHFRELVDILKDEYLAYPPRYTSTYSNCAVALLGIVIENVSGVEFKTYVKNNICRPLNMLASNFSFRDYMTPILAKPYDSAGAESPFFYIRDEPAGAFISNTLEMSLFMRMILNGGILFGRRILQQSTLEQMFVPQNSDIELDFPNDHGAQWGLSWALSAPPLAYAGKYAGHNGNIPNNYSAQMHILPEHGLAVIVVTNHSFKGPQICVDIADMAMIKALEILKGIERPDPQPLPPMVPLTQDHVVQAAGTYTTMSYGLLSIYPKNDGLFANCTKLESLELELLPHEDNWFSLYLNGQPAPGFENLRVIVKDGAQERFVGSQSRDANGSIYTIPIGREYQIPDQLPPEWMERVGRYNIINPDPYMLIDGNASIQILPSGVMYHTIPNFSSNVLDPIYENEAIRTGLGRNVNETIQVVDCDGEQCLYHLGLLFKKDSDVQASPEIRGAFSASDLHKKGKEMESELIQRFRFPGLTR